MKQRGRLVLALFLFAVAVCQVHAGDSRRSSPPPDSPLSTEDALKSFELASPDLRVELAAAEPEIVDPVAIAFGTDGCMWVVEMRDYPRGPKALSRIKRLYDKNRDGRYETASVFVDELLFATGVQPWKDGIIVTLSGEIAFFADRDGDGKAEHKETWFGGFSQDNTQLRANHPTFGPDGWIYVANGLRGGTIVAAKPEWKDKGAPVALAGFDFRFNPLTGESGTVSGHGQFGLCFDDYGNRFVCSNRNPVQHVVLEDHYVKRNPFLAVTKVINDVAAFAEHSRLHPISKAWTTSNLHANQFTAACGVQIYRGDALPPEFLGNALTCDPTGNLVHREVLVSTGATFTAHSSDGDQEFLASSDTWFRPVNISNAPDGSLYVVDMYRAVIEHPDWMPAELKNRKDLLDGSDRGRIWRIAPVESTMLQERPDEPLDQLTIKDLIELLEHRNAWHRETAMRLLIERNPHEVLDALKLNWKQNKLTRSRLRVLWMLKILDPRLTPAMLAWSETENRDARVREHVVATIGDNLDELLADQAMDLVNEETDERVRFRLALDLSGRSEDAVAARSLLIRLVDRGAADPWLRTAIATTRCNPSPALVTELLDHWKSATKLPAGAVELIEELSDVCGAQMNEQSAAQFLNAVLGFSSGAIDSKQVQEVQMAGLRGFAQGGARRGIAVLSQLGQLGTMRQDEFKQLLKRTRVIMMDKAESVPQRLVAIRTIRFSPVGEIAVSLLDLGISDDDMTLRQAALEALSHSNDATIGPKLLGVFESQTPPVKRSILDVMMTDEGRALLLVEALESGTMKLTEIDAARWPRLTKHRNKDISSRAEKLFGAGPSPDRAAVLAAYQPALATKGDPKRGRVLFEKNCVTCHRVADVGVNVGPDISDTRDKTPAYLLTNILDPNRAVDANYFGYTVITKQGRVLTGLIKGETASSITIRLPEGKEESVLRADLDEIKSSGLSLMPVGMEKTISVEQMADLIAFLKNWRYLDGSIPLNE